MFDREKQVVINRYFKAIFHETEKISVSDLLNLNIPDSVKSFISREIENKIDQEFNEIKKFSKFNFDHQAVKPLVDELKVLLKFTRELSAEELSILFKFALDLYLDYLLKPCDTLTAFVFKYEEYQTISVIRERLKFINEYEYFPLLLNEYFNRSGITKISRSDFLNLLYKIEREYTRDFTILDHYNLFSRFKDFLLELNLFINDYPEYEAFIIHLQDKNHKELAKLLEEQKEQFRISGKNVKSYLNFLIRPVQEDIKQKLEVKTELAEFNNQVTLEEEKIKSAAEISQGETKIDYEISLDKKLKEINSAEDLSAKKTEEKINQHQKSELYGRLTPTQTGEKQKKFDRNLDGLMPVRFRKKIIKKIFDDNEFAFADFMHNINKVENWDEASMLLTDLFDKRNIQPFSKWAIKFTEFLYENIK